MHRQVTSHILWRSFRPFSSLSPTIKQVLSNKSKQNIGELNNITIYGWIKSVRRQKNVSFGVVNDGTTLRGLQAVFLHSEAHQTTALKNVTTGSSVRLTGKLIESPGKGQEHELRVESFEVLGECDSEEYPIQKKDHSTEFLREHSHLRARTTNIAAMLRVRDKFVRVFGDWYENAGFVHAHLPVMTTNDCEGAGEAFRVVSDPPDPPPDPVSLPPSCSLHTPPTFLTTSTQLHLEALASSLARVYTIAPSFRAERSQTNRHLSEFWMIEAEMSFLRAGVQDVCDVVENSLKFALESLGEDEDVKFLRGTSDVGGNLNTWLDPSIQWRRITYSEALIALQKHHVSGAEPKFQFGSPEWGEALRSEHERWIADSLGGNAQGSQIGGPVFVTDYPRRLKPFYMWVNDKQKEGETRSTVACFDLLVPKLGELTGGSVRESRVDVLRESLALHDMDEADYSWYIDLRRYGTTPHGGFGVGFERLVSWFCGIDNVRECLAFPRWAGRILL
ncbi:asparaginyl-tRNA synthetase [Ramaria rubella]|nr:asparaginyl-tRNA synthetase [Ramaria rubella]